MNALTETIHSLLPFLGFILLLIGIRLHRISYILVALWISLIAFILYYYTTGHAFFGTYFEYKNATLYTLYLFTLIGALLYILFSLPGLQRRPIRYFTAFFSALIVTGGFILLINIWMNAWFISNRLPGTAIMQVGTFTPLSYCNNRYVFYKVGMDGKVYYLCPNHYRFIPSIGELETTPDFLLNQMAKQAQQKSRH